MLHEIWLGVRKGWQRLLKPAPKYYMLNFFRDKTWEIAIVRLEPQDSSDALHGPVLTEKDLIPDIADIPTTGTGIRHEGLKRPCDYAMKETLKIHTKQINPGQATEINSF